MGCVFSSSTWNSVAFAFILSGFTAPAVAQVVAPPAPAPASVAVAQPATASMPLQPLVEKLIREAGIGATVCVYAETPDDKVMANVNGTKVMIPASNNKLVTTAAALTLLGPEFRFKTQFFGTGPVINGTLQGDLIVYGGGDPGISGRYQANKEDVTAIMRKWADELKSAGIKAITGNIVADDSYFDDVYFHPSWYAKERGEYYSAEVSGLAFNDNCIDITWSGMGKMPDEAAAYTLNPITDYVKFESSVTIAAKGRETERYYALSTTDNHITATGNLTVETTNVDSASIHDGALYCATVFADVLSSQGIDVKGKPVKERGAATRTPAPHALFSFADHSMLQICETINLNSQNFFAECVAKTLGKERAGEGSYAAGTRVIEEFCKSHDIYSVGHDAEDGSGLAGENNVTGHQLVDILQYMDRNGLKDQWRGTLPQGHVRGSLKNRFPGVAEAKRILGKTGLIGGVRSLSGVVTDAAGKEIYYSIIVNDLKNADASKAMMLIDQIAVELAKSKA